VGFDFDREACAKLTEERQIVGQQSNDERARLRRSSRCKSDNVEIDGSMVDGDGDGDTEQVRVFGTFLLKFSLPKL